MNIFNEETPGSVDKFLGDKTFPHLAFRNYISHQINVLAFTENFHKTTLLPLLYIWILSMI